MCSRLAMVAQKNEWTNKGMCAQRETTDVSPSPMDEHFAILPSGHDVVSWKLRKVRNIYCPQCLPAGLSLLQ